MSPNLLIMIAQRGYGISFDNYKRILRDNITIYRLGIDHAYILILDCKRHINTQRIQMKY